jgi:excisionase family DNA binding protein
MRTTPARDEVREVMDIRMASDYLGISPDTLYKYASDGFVPAFKLGNRWRFKRSRLDEWMDQQSSQGAQKTAIGGSPPEKSRRREPINSFTSKLHRQWQRGVAFLEERPHFAKLACADWEWKKSLGNFAITVA